MSERTTCLLPTPGDISGLLVAFSAAMALGSQLLNTDGDPGRHLRVGRELLAHGLFHTDYLICTMADSADGSVRYARR